MVINGIRNWISKLSKQINRNKVFIIFLSFAEALFLSLIMSNTAHTNTDAVIPFMFLDRDVVANGVPIKLSETVNLTHLAVEIGYLFYGMSIKASRMMSGILFFPCYFMAAWLMLNTKKNKYLVFLGSFIMVFWIFPTYHSNIFHYSAAFLTLFIYYYIDARIWEKGWKTNFIALIIIVIALCYYGKDYLLLVTSIIVPIVIFFGIECFKDERKRPIITKVLLLFTLILCGSFVILKATGVDGILSGIYGAGSYTQWASVKDIVTIGVPMVSDLLVYGFSLPYRGTILSTMFVLYVARYLLVVLSGFALIRNLYLLFNKNYQIDKADAIFTISVVMNICIFVTLKSTLYSYNYIGYWTDMARYCVPCCFVMPILGVRSFIDILERKVKIGHNNSYKYIAVVGGGITVCLTILMRYAIVDDRYWGYKDLSTEAASILTSQYTDYYSEGVAYSPYIFAGVTINGEGEITATPVSNSGVYYPEYLPELYENYRFMSFVVADASDDRCYSIVEAQDSIAKVDINSFSSLTGEVEDKLGTIFYFDHDVRWIPKIFYGEEITNIDKWKVTCGTTRIRVCGENLKEDALIINVPEKLVVVAEVNDKGVDYLIESDKNVDIRLNVNSDRIESVEIVPVYAANKVMENEEIEIRNEKYIDTCLNNDEYYMSIWGDNIDLLEVEVVSSENIGFECLSGGTGQRVYKVSNDYEKSDARIKFRNIGDKNILIEGVAFEASFEDMTEIRSQYQEEYLGWITKDF